MVHEQNIGEHAIAVVALRAPSNRRLILVR